jgi:hypothetical protein
MRRLLLLAVAGAVQAGIPWPVYPTNNTHTLYHSYGDYHRDWFMISPSQPWRNFHFGIDMAVPEGGSDDVYVVESGTITDIYQSLPAMYEYAFVVCHADTFEQGWMYGHLDNEFLRDVGDPVSMGDQLASMNHLVTPVHLHFMRSLCVYDDDNPGERNPLQSFMYPPVGSFWSIQSVLPCRFVNDHDIQYWETNWQNPASIDTIPRDALCGSLDVLQGFSVWTDGAVDPQEDYHWAAPERISWRLERWNVETGWKTVLDYLEKPYERYVYEFNGELGASVDYEKYKQLYFCQDVTDWFGSRVGYGDMYCVTNCGEADSWINLGLSNIREGCWQTNEKADHSGPTSNPILQLTPDGQYRLKFTPWVFNGCGDPPQALEPVVVDVQLCNSSPVVRRVEAGIAGIGSFYDAEWGIAEVSAGLIPYLFVTANDPVEVPETGLQVCVHVTFSEPVNTSTCVITAGKASGYSLPVETIGWQCTNNPDLPDEWMGILTIPNGSISGFISLRVEAEDLSGNALVDPELLVPVDEDYQDDHHGFQIEIEQVWPDDFWPSGPGMLLGPPFGSVCLGDLDNPPDGTLEMAVRHCCGGIGDGNPGNDVYDWQTEVLNSDGSSRWCADDLVASTSTDEILLYLTSPAIADIDGDGGLDVISTMTSGLVVRDGNDGSLIPGTWPVQVVDSEQNPVGSFDMASPAIGDLNGDSELEIIICREMLEAPSLETASVFAYSHLGSLIWKRTLGITPEDGAPVYVTPCVCDVNGDGLTEVLVITGEDVEGSDGFGSSMIYLLSGSSGATLWSYPEIGYINSLVTDPPVVVDLDDNGHNEVVYIENNLQGFSSIVVLNGVTGSYISSAAINSSSGLGIADINQDGLPDVVSISSGSDCICAWTGLALNTVEGFPVSINEYMSFAGNSAPLIADVDTDKELEFVFLSAPSNQGGEYTLRAVNLNGSEIPGFPMNLHWGSSAVPEPCGQVVAGDVDGDDHLELLFAANIPFAMWCFDAGSHSFPCDLPWRQFQHDSWHSGCASVDNSIPAPPSDLGYSVEYLVTGGYRATLSWTLSPNDPLSGDPDEPADVTNYEIFRCFGQGEYPPTPIGRTHSGDNSFTDVCTDPGGPSVRYVVRASDGVNSSTNSNEIRFRTSYGLNLACSCPVREYLASDLISTSRLPSSSIAVMDRATLGECADAHESYPGLLTDGVLSEEYIPDSRTRGIETDLGRVCTIQRIDLVTNQRDSITSALSYGYHIDVSSSGTDWINYAEDAAAYTRPVSGRYIRITPAPSAYELYVWGVSDLPLDCQEAEITQRDCGWEFIIPTDQYPAGYYEVKIDIYDISGRMIRTLTTVAGSVVTWDGTDNSGQICPNGNYFVRVEIGDEVSTARLVVSSDTAGN